MAKDFWGAMTKGFQGGFGSTFGRSWEATEKQIAEQKYKQAIEQDNDAINTVVQGLFEPEVPEEQVQGVQIQAPQAQYSTDGMQNQPVSFEGLPDIAPVGEIVPNVQRQEQIKDITNYTKEYSQRLNEKLTTGLGSFMELYGKLQTNEGRNAWLMQQREIERRRALPTQADLDLLPQIARAFEIGDNESITMYTQKLTEGGIKALNNIMPMWSRTKAEKGYTTKTTVDRETAKAIAKESGVPFNPNISSNYTITYDNTGRLTDIAPFMKESSGGGGNRGSDDGTFGYRMNKITQADIQTTTDIINAKDNVRNNFFQFSADYTTVDENIPEEQSPFWLRKNKEAPTGKELVGKAISGNSGKRTKIKATPSYTFKFEGEVNEENLGKMVNKLYARSNGRLTKDMLRTALMAGVEEGGEYGFKFIRENDGTLKELKLIPKGNIDLVINDAQQRYENRVNRMRGVVYENLRHEDVPEGVEARIKTLVDDPVANGVPYKTITNYILYQYGAKQLDKDQVSSLLAYLHSKTGFVYAELLKDTKTVPGGANGEI